MANQRLVSLALAGLLGATLGMSQQAAHAADGKASEGKCVGANACKGHGACSTASNDCAGKNGCKGEGWVKSTASECKKLSKKFKKSHFEASEEKKS